jgi:hypothetical protein
MWGKRIKIAIVALAALAAVGFIVLKFAGTGEFGFIGDAKPLTFKTKSELIKNWEKEGGRFTAYSFKGDYSRISKQAQQEMKADGFEEIKDWLDPARKLVAFRKTVEPDKAELDKPESSLKDSLVYVLADTKFDADEELPDTPPEPDSPGWVSVVTFTKEAPTALQKFKRWLGL